MNRLGGQCSAAGCSRANISLKESRVPEAWKALDDGRLAEIRLEVEKRLAAIQTLKKPNEAETEKDLIWPVLETLGWTETLPQQNLSVDGREKCRTAFCSATRAPRPRLPQRKVGIRFRDGLCIMEAKRWSRPLDRKDATDGATPEFLEPDPQLICAALTT